MKSLWHWEKHDIVNYLRKNSFDEEFTILSLIKKITKSKYSYYGYTHSIFVKILSELVVDGYLEVRYVSDKMEPSTVDAQPSVRSTANKFAFGSKTIAIYKVKNETNS